MGLSLHVRGHSRAGGHMLTCLALEPQLIGERKSKVVGSLTGKWNSLWLLAGLAAASLNVFPAVAAFQVTDTSGRKVRFTPLRDKATVVIFVSTRCPISNAFNYRINEIYNRFRNRARFVVLDSNVNETIEEVRVHAKNMEYDFPLYVDSNNAVADLLGAKATPDSFVIDRKGNIAYHGYIEDAPNPQRTKNHALLLAIEAALENRPAPVAETHARGCAIRRANNEAGRHL